MTTTKQTIYFTMVHHPTRGTIRAGNACMTRKAAQQWLPMLRKMWRGCKTSVASCTLRYEDGKLTPKSIAVLDRKFNMDPPKEPTP